MTELPELPLEAWEPTRNTLQLWCQIVGKVKLATAHPLNDWWHVTLFVDVNGLTTRRLTHNGNSFRIDFDLLEHTLRVLTDDGRIEEFELHDGLSVAAFDRRLHAALASLGVDVELVERPYKTPISEIPFPEDLTHASYDPDYAQRYWRALEWIDDVFSEHAGRFSGKQSPVHLFWHSFDLALTRFSGQSSDELISAGFWPGDPNTRFPAFYSYTAPEPPELTRQPLEPAAAWWEELPDRHMALLEYETVRTAADPRSQLLAFLESAYRAGARAGAWDTARLEPATPALR